MHACRTRSGCPNWIPCNPVRSCAAPPVLEIMAPALQHGCPRTAGRTAHRRAVASRAQLRVQAASRSEAACEAPQLGRRQVLAAVAAGSLLAGGQQASAFTAPPPGYRLYNDRLDGYQVGVALAICAACRAACTLIGVCAPCAVVWGVQIWRPPSVGGSSWPRPHGFRSQPQPRPPRSLCTPRTGRPSPPRAMMCSCAASTMWRPMCLWS